MKIFKTILLIYAVSLFSATLLPKLAIFSALPNIILILSLLLLFHNEFKIGLLWACLGGLFLDFFNAGFPYNIFITITLFLLSWFLIKRFFESSNIYLFLGFCFFGSLFYDLTFILIHHISHFSFTIFLNALYTTFLSLIFIFIYNLLQKKVKKRLSLIYWELR